MFVACCRRHSLLTIYRPNFAHRANDSCRRVSGVVGPAVVKLSSGFKARALATGFRSRPGREDVVLYLEDALVRVDDPEVDDRGHAGGDVVAGDDLLRRHLHGDGPQVYLDHPSPSLERQSSNHAAVAFRSSAGIVRAITCRLCTTAERLRSKRFLRTPL